MKTLILAPVVIVIWMGLLVPSFRHPSAWVRIDRVSASLPAGKRLLAVLAVRE